MDGLAADYVNKRGYILAPYGEVDIEGFRTSVSQVATFRFAAVADSYAAKTGDARNVGVIGVAFFPERYVAPPPPPLYYPPASASETEQKRSADAIGRLAPAPKSAPARGDSSGAGHAARAGSPAAERRPGLGTEFGEGRQSQVVETSFERANTAAPAQVFAIRYNNRAGLESLGIVFPPPPRPRDVDGELRENAQPFPQNARFAQPPPR
jgi:hypothetical protein